MEGKSFLKAKVTSKNQITIPKEICQLLDINEGDKVTFEYENNKLIFDIEKEKCFACNGIGLIGKDECFICGGKRKLYKDTSNSIYKLIGEISKNAFKYNVGIMLSQQELKDGFFTYKEIPTLRLKSNKYPKDELIKIQDEIQKIIIKFVAPKSLENTNKYCEPNENDLDIILSTLINNEAKEEVYKWFRE